MDYKSIINGLEEAVKISEGQNIGRKKRISIAPLKDYSYAQIKDLRLELRLTQLAFASLLGVSVKTVEAWEKGRNTPNGPARRLMELLYEDMDIPEKYQLIVE